LKYNGTMLYLMFYIQYIKPINQPNQLNQLINPITTSPHHHITTSPHHHIITSPHHHITTSPHHHITTLSHHHITTSSHHHIITLNFILFCFKIQSIALFLFMVCRFNFFIGHYFRNFVSNYRWNINENPI